MPTYTSKTLIPGQTPIGQNKDGSYIYEQNMIVSPKNTPIAPKKPVTLPTPLPMNKVSGIGIMPQVNPDIAQKVNAPVNDSLKINEKIDNNSQRVKDLRQHFESLKQKGEYELNEKQSDYIKRFKTKNPDYKNVPDVILYSKIILADPKRMDEYGNV